MRKIHGQIRFNKFELAQLAKENPRLIDMTLPGGIAEKYFLHRNIKLLVPIFKDGGGIPCPNEAFEGVIEYCCGGICVADTRYNKVGSGCWNHRWNEAYHG